MTHSLHFCNALVTSGAAECVHERSEFNTRIIDPKVLVE